ncbi:hypothetical protein [Bradyrhizobium sp. S3.7.6]
MARGFTQTYRTYNFVDKNPVVDKIRTVLQEEGFFAKKRRRTLHELSGVAVATFDGWFEGETRNPRHETIMATMSALGYKEEFVKVKTIDEQKELEKARVWFEQQKELRDKSKSRSKRATNGRASKKRAKR